MSNPFRWGVGCGCGCGSCPPCYCTGNTYSDGSITDPSGTLPLPRGGIYGGLSGQAWGGCHTLTTTAYDYATDTTGTFPVAVGYSVACGPEGVKILRRWLTTYVSKQLVHSTCPDLSPVGWTGAGPPGIGGILVQSVATSWLIPSDCAPLTVSGSLALGGSYPDPASGAISLTFPLCVGSTQTLCSPCTIPNHDLAVSWTNTGGNGSATLVYSSTGPTWDTACITRGSASMRVRLQCEDGTMLLTVGLWTGSSSCVGTPFQYTSNPGGSLSITSSTCSPLSITWTVDSSSGLYAAGFRTFTATL